MKKRPHALRRFVRGLGLVTLASVSLSNAQTDASTAPLTAKESPLKLDTFVTTGSRLSRAAVENTVPTITIEREQIEQSGALDIQNFLRDQSFTIGAGNNSPTVFNNSFTASTIGLRGLGSRNTLALINGRRMANFGINQAYDLSLVPASAVKRVEVVRSGASAIYGTDAVAGVINLILRDDFEGGYVSARYGSPTQSGGGKHQEYSVGYGLRQGGMTILLGASFEKQTEILQSARTWSLGPAGYSTSTNPGRFVFSGSPALPNGVYTLAQGVSVARSAADFKVFNGSTEVPAGDLFNFGLFEPILRPYERTSFSASWSGQLGKSAVEFFGDFQYQKQRQPQARAPILNIVGTAQPNLWIPADNYWNRQIFGANAVAIRDWRYRFTEFGKSQLIPEMFTTRIAAGLRGRIFERFAWETATVYSEFYQNSTFPSTVNLTKLEESIKRTTPNAFNPFTRDYLNPSGSQNPTSVIEELRGKTTDITTSRLVTYDAKLSGPVITLGTGDVEAAVGTELRLNEGKIERDPLQLQSGATQFGLKTTVYAAFAELSVPVTKKIRLGGALRHEDYENRFSTTVTSVTSRFDVTEGVILRASYSEGFVPPSIGDLATPQSNAIAGTLNVTDPRPNATTRAYDMPFIRVLPTDLKPEETQVINIGAAYSSKRFKGFSAILDYYTIEQENLITGPGNQLGQFIVNANVAGGGPTNASAPFASQLVFDPIQNIYVLAYLSPANVSALKTDGIDLEFEQRVESQRFGRFVFSLVGTRLLSFDRQTIAGGATTKLLGLSESTATYPRWKGNFSVAWQRNKFNAYFKTLYNGRLTGFVGAPATTKGYKESFIFDLSAGYRLPWGIDATLGVNNLLDKDPPTNPASLDNNFPTQGYDPRGRFIYTRFTRKF